MELFERALKNKINSTTMQVNAKTLNKISAELDSLRCSSYASTFESAVLYQSSQILRHLAIQHQVAVDLMVQEENRTRPVIERAKQLFFKNAAASGLTTAGKIAMVAFTNPAILYPKFLSVRSDAIDLVGPQFHESFDIMARRAFRESDEKQVDVKVTVDEIWTQFESTRNSVEKRLANRVKGYDEQIAHFKAHVGNTYKNFEI